MNRNKMEQLEEIFRFVTGKNKEDFVNAYEPKLRDKASYLWDTYKRRDQDSLSKMTQKLKEFVNTYEPILRAKAPYVFDKFKRCGKSLIKKMIRCVFCVYSKIRQELKDIEC